MDNNLPNNVVTENSPEISNLSDEVAISSDPALLVVDHQSATPRKFQMRKRSSRLAYIFAGLLLVLLAVGGVSAYTLMQSGQDLRQQASGFSYIACKTNADCKVNDTCSSAHVCVPVVTCGTNADCPAGSACNIGHTCAPVVTPAPAVIPCGSDRAGNCPTGYTCDMKKRACSPLTKCSAMSECFPGTLCDEGYCQTIKTCATKRECVGTQICDGKCRACSKKNEGAWPANGGNSCCPGLKATQADKTCNKFPNYRPCPAQVCR